MRKKKLWALLLALTMVASTALTACGNGSGNTSQEEKKEETVAAGQNEDGQNEDSSDGEDAGEAGEDENAGSGETVKLRMVTYLGNPQRDELIQEIISQLDGIELEIVTPPSEQAQQKIKTMLQSGETIDIIEFDSIQVEYVQNDFIHPLNDYTAAWDEWDSVSETLKDQLTSYDGNVYSIPYGVYERALFYRKDWFEEKNLEVPQTWEELYQTGLELTDPDQNRYGYSFRGGPGTAGFMQMTVLSHMKPDVVDISTPFVTKEGKSMYTYQEAADALAFYKKLYDEISHPDAISWGYPEMVEAFYSGTTAMLIQDPEVVATCEEYMEEGTWDVAPLPVGPEGKALFPAGFAGWAIVEKSENKDAAWRVIEALSSVEGNTYFCKKNGNIPIHTTAQDDPFFSDGYYGCYIDMSADPDKYVGYVDGGENRYATKEEVDRMSDFGTAADEIVQSILLGAETPEQGCERLASYYDWVETSEWVQERTGN